MSYNSRRSVCAKLLVLSLVAALSGACDPSATRVEEPALAEHALRVGDIDPFAVIAAAPTAGYRAGLGTLPEAQGWTYFDYTANPVPVVAQGALVATNTNGEQSWGRAVANIDLTRGFAFEARIKVISSNHIPNIGTGTREGYYIILTDAVQGYSIGLADGGFSVNSICTPNQPITLYPFANGRFHEVRFRVNAGKATMSINGTVVATNIAPVALATCRIGSVDMVTFGGHAGASRSVTELKDFVYRAF